MENGKQMSAEIIKTDVFPTDASRQEVAFTGFGRLRISGDQRRVLRNDLFKKWSASEELGVTKHPGAGCCGKYAKDRILQA